MARQQHGVLARVSRSFFQYLGHQLDSLTPAGVWRVVGLSIVCITGTDMWLQSSGLFVSPLYVLPLCLAGWRLGLRAGLAVAAAVSVISSVVILLVDGLPTGTAIGQMLLLALMLGVIAGVVWSFRNSLDRERDHASRDLLTGALNRHAFAELADAALAAGRRQSFVLAFVDLDGFKAVNDRHGHYAGDLVLERFSRAAMRELRGVDCFARLGGDEFAVLAPIERDDRALYHAAYLHRRFSTALAGTGYEVTCSMGALIVPAGSGRTCAELMHEADRLMYSAKHGGKNRVRIEPAAAVERIAATRPQVAPVAARPAKQAI